MNLTLHTFSLHMEGEVLLEPIDLSIEAGQIVTLMGPSGSGKSSLINALAGLYTLGITPKGGIDLEGEDLSPLPAHQRRLGLLLQDPLLFPHLSVAGNLAFGLAPGLSRSQRQQRVEGMLKELALSDYGSRDPATLSGGQKARIALGRTLLSEPRALLLDEPFSKLDAELRFDMRTLVFELVRSRGLPTLLVTHDLEDAHAAAGPIYQFQGGRLVPRPDAADS